MRVAVLASSLALAAGFASAATPEVQRPVGAPQANGVTHLARGIPEACAWLEGTFTGDPALPYKFAPVRSSPTCQARARLLNPEKAKPSEATGWKLNDIVRIPSKDCPGLQAVITVWRLPVDEKSLKLDAQGRARLYLQDAKASAGKAPMAAYTATVATEGKPCGG
ncbi:hypothetical protein DWG18_10365 [Lysobacter sp. TY2-98]|uniref:hypothetical protein n=1 Tax=Lysobacter sp. TY2-98 TaxID=2290922 RepID=UPI000E202033|nr:hypothetical protein [Lysobacter sp. TY2-98]AXK72633.1 hypothetical protein DWG18_10365 [Lysobacter sp. TY2-98]